MSALWAKLLVLGNAVLLAFPLGWCCPVSAARAGDNSPPPAHCCGACQEDPSESTPAPATPARDCCCDRDTNVPPVTEKYHWVPGLALLAFAVGPEDTACSTAPVLVTVEPFESPPLQLRFCVWRC